MILYHFCSRRHVKSIQRHGLTEGGLAVQTPTGFHLRTGFQWLTKDGDKDRQSWATRNLIKYSRTEYRLTLNIPDEYVGKKLFSNTAFILQYPEAEPLFDMWPGSENWMVFKGTIPKEWIVDVVKTDQLTERQVEQDVS